MSTSSNRSSSRNSFLNQPVYDHPGAIATAATTATSNTASFTSRINSSRSSLASFPNNSIISQRTVTSLKQPSSAYVPQDRFSRYLTALSSLAFIKFKRLPGSELPLDKIGLITSITLGWLTEYLNAGFKNSMRDKIMPSLSQRETCDVNGPRLESLLQAHFVEKGQAGASIPRVAWRFVRTRVLIGSFLHFLGTLLSLMGPIFILSTVLESSDRRGLMTDAASSNATNATDVSLRFVDFSTTVPNISDHNDTITISNTSIQYNDVINYYDFNIFTYTAALVVVEIVSQFLVAWSSALNLRTACRLRSACLAVCYKKLLRSSLINSTGAQQTLTYFVPDSETLHELVGVGPLVFSGPAALIIVTVYTYNALGAWALSGIVMVLILYSSLVVSAYFTKSYAGRAIEYSLKRISLVEEFVSNIQLAKITLWDRHFHDKIKDVRKKELAEMRYGGFSEGCGLSMIHMLPVFSLVTITLVSLILDKQISFVRYGPVLVLFLVNLKLCIRTSWMALSSISRGLSFLNKLKEILTLQEPDKFYEKPIDKNYSVIIHNGNFTWSKNSNDSNNKLRTVQNGKRSSRFYVDGEQLNAIEFNFSSPLVTTLSEIDFYVPKGKLVGIYGHQDSGKSSFLLSILGQLRRTGGNVAVDGTFAYVSREPWLMDGTVKENILFGEHPDNNKLSRMVRAAKLTNDIATLPELEDTEIDSINLTLAFKQKLSMARICYAQRDINLIDEPLSDLSVNERIEVFDRCISHLLGYKTVIVASDRVELLSRCHVIYVMVDGRIIANGNHEELVRCNTQYAKLTSHQMKTIMQQQKKPKNGDYSSSSPSRLTASTGKELISSNGSSFNSIDRKDDSARLLYGKHLDFPVIQCSFDETAKPKTGTTVYQSYSGGWSVCILLCLLSIFYACSVAIAPYCIIHVQQASFLQKDTEEIKMSLGVLATLVGFLVGCGIILLVAYSKTIFMASAKLHENWIENLSCAQIPVFSTSTISFILNICSLNLQEVDSALPRSIIIVLINIGISIVSIVILGIISPWLILPVLAYAICALLCSIYIRRAVLCLHELKVSSATFVLNYINNTVLGRATIQAFAREKDFTKKYYKLFNENSTYDLMLYATKLWLEFRLKMLSVLVLCSVIFLTEVFIKNSNSTSWLCLAYVITMQLSFSVLHGVGAVNNIYTSLMAINSIDHYIKTIPKEKEGSARVRINWPTEGSIEFRDVFLFDREESNHRPLKFNIANSQTISLISNRLETRKAFVSAMFRFFELPGGEITIDRASVSQLPLNTLRRCICFIPGNPTLFSGTIRYNLDPSEKLTDQTLMMILQKVYLWEKILRLPEKLVSNSRNLFNVYEKILIFLARALLSEHVKIIILEEPEMDVTDKRGEILEIVLKNVFAEYTIIRLANHKVKGCSKYIPLDDEIDDYNYDRASSDLSQMTDPIYDTIPSIKSEETPNTRLSSE
ncbi:hypothetical protein TKK_0015884 [Trichogramma kaykai]|uniref:Uncharacterized protein n=1 Tax=Trichogramma kaykai TaxID=54128 RepID=A0ABD2W8P6_9HYME